MPRDLLSLERDSRDWNVAPRAAYFSPTRPPSSRLHPPLISLPLAPSFFHRCRYATKAFEILSPRLTYNNNVNFLRAEKRFVSMDEESGSYFSSLLFSLFLPKIRRERHDCCLNSNVSPSKTRKGEILLGKISRPANTGHANWVGAASLNETVCAVNRVNEWESRDVSSQLLWL